MKDMSRKIFQLKKVSALALLLISCLPVQIGLAQETIYTRTTRGAIETIDLENREAVISGYRYYFGHVQYNTVTTIKMFQSQSGAFELLTVGMKVELVYADYGYSRYAVLLQQLSDAETDYVR